MTDEALSDTGDETKEQINFWESEIRKLWAVSNERNKKWIEDNRATAARNDADIGAVETTVAALQASVARQTDVAARQQEIADQVAELDLTLRRLINQQRLQMLAVV